MTTLSPPTIPSSPHPPSADLAAVVGAELAAPLVRLEACLTEAAEAVREWETSRPSVAGFSDGAAWSSALAADVTTAATGERPKTWKAATLLQAEPVRWARAHALAGSVVEVIAATTSALDLVTITEEAGGVESASAEEWAAAAWSGWTTRGDKAAAWQEVRRGETFLGEYLSARRVKDWAEGQGWGARPESDVRVPRVDYLPDDPVGRGAWLALGLFLSPEPWLSMPQNVTWPEGSELLVTTALPGDGARYTALVGTGVHVEKR